MYTVIVATAYRGTFRHEFTDYNEARECFECYDEIASYEDDDEIDAVDSVWMEKDGVICN